MGYRPKARCAICGERGRPGDPITRGHIIPRAFGGTDSTFNIQPEHKSCNEAKAATYTRATLVRAMERRSEVRKAV
jgi:5-methylcytosine-specific restriction endonuclease McrA